MREPICEPCVVPEQFVSRLWQVESIGDGLVRLTFVTKGRSAMTGDSELTVAARLIMSEVAARAMQPLLQKPLPDMASPLGWMDTSLPN